MKLTTIFLCVLCVFVVSVSGCTLFGSKTSPAEIRKACGAALNETSIIGDITIQQNDDTMTGTITGRLTNDTPPGSGGLLPSADNGSMILKLLNMTWLFLVIQILITWAVTILLKLKGVKVSLLSVSILVNISVILITALMIYLLGWIKSNPIDVFGTQVFGWGIQSLLYDSVVKKLITKQPAKGGSNSQ